jgi:hypothetical protein
MRLNTGDQRYNNGKKNGQKEVHCVVLTGGIFIYEKRCDSYGHSLEDDYNEALNAFL